MCAGKLQAIFCGFDKGERGQIPRHKASGRALYGRRAFVHCQLPLEWHAPIASVAALSERLAGCRFGGTPADRTRHCRGAACRSRRGAADWCRLALNGENQRFVIARALRPWQSREGSYVFAGSTQLSGRVLRDSHVASLLGMTRQGGAAVHQCSYAVE